MMGREISDPDGVEGEVAAAEGLCLLPTSTVLRGNKTIKRGVYCERLRSNRVGYEIHMGETGAPADASPLVVKSDGM